MEFTVLSENLKAALKLVAPAVAKKSTLEVLQAVRFRMDGSNVIEVGANNLGVGIYVKFGAMIANGDTADFGVDYRELLRAFDSSYDGKGRVTLRSGPDGSGAELEVAGRVYSLTGYAGNEFPQRSFPDDIKEAATLHIQPDGWRDLAFTARAAGSDDTRMSLQGVFLESSPDDRIKATATDGFVMHHSTPKAVQMEGPMNWTFLMPAADILTVAKWLPKKSTSIDDPIELILPTDGSLRYLIRYGGVELLGLKNDGKFPDYEPIIPTTYNHEILIDRDGLLDALAQISKIGLGGKKHTPATATVTSVWQPAGGGAIRIQGKTGEKSRASWYVPTYKDSGDFPAFAIDPYLLLNGVRDTDYLSLRLRITSANEPLAFFAGGRMIIIMPMKVKWDQWVDPVPEAENEE